MICNVVNDYPEAATSYADNDGRVPLHAIAENGEVWDGEAGAIFGANEAAVRTRAGPEFLSRSPINMALCGNDNGRVALLQLCNAAHGARDGLPRTVGMA